MRERFYQVKEGMRQVEIVTASAPWPILVIKFPMSDIEYGEMMAMLKRMELPLTQGSTDTEASITKRPTDKDEP